MGQSPIWGQKSLSPHKMEVLRGQFCGIVGIVGIFGTRLDPSSGPVPASLGTSTGGGGQPVSQTNSPSLRAGPGGWSFSDAPDLTGQGVPAPVGSEGHGPPVQVHGTVPLHHWPASPLGCVTPDLAHVQWSCPALAYTFPLNVRNNSRPSSATVIWKAFACSVRNDFEMFFLAVCFGLNPDCFSLIRYSVVC